jgi:ABC-2 type transport system permease protein
VFGGSLLVSCINFIPIYATAVAERAGQSYEFYHIGPVTGALIGNLIGLLLLGAAFIALGTFISALTENQLAAAVITISVIFLMLGLGLVSSLIDVYWIRMVLSWISVYSRFGNFQNGLFDFAAILYYASICFIFVFLTVRVYEKRRWN